LVLKGIDNSNPTQNLRLDRFDQMVLEACRAGRFPPVLHTGEGSQCKLIAERIAIDHHRELIRHFGERDPGTRTMLEGILVVEEEHANDMHDLLVARRQAHVAQITGPSNSGASPTSSEEL
jgi:ferritin-like protein